MKTSILIISLLVQSIFSNFLNIHISFFNPLFSLSALIIIYPYYKNKRKFFITVFIFGICYDVLFSGFILIHSFLFLLIGVIIMIMYKLWNSLLLNIIIFQIITIIVYQNFYYFIITIIDKLSWNSLMIFKLVMQSLLANIIFISLLYLITEKISKKYKIRKIG